MVEKEKKELRKILGEVQFDDLDLLFKNGRIWTGPEYSAGFSFLGFSGTSLNEENHRNWSYHVAEDVSGTIEQWFVTDFPNHAVSEWIDLRKMYKRQGTPERFWQGSAELVQGQRENLVSKARFFLENRNIRDYLVGLKTSQSVEYGLYKTGGLFCKFSLPFLSGLVFGNKSPNQLMDLRETSLARMYGQGSFSEGVRDLVLREGLGIEHVDTVSVYNSPSLKNNLDLFVLDFFHAMCKDEREHDESKYKTKP